MNVLNYADVRKRIRATVEKKVSSEFKLRILTLISEF